MAERYVGILDMLGPVMIGPSSSHTAGVARLAFLAGSMLPTRPERAVVEFHGSLARTWLGHGSDCAAIAGLLGILPEDERLAYARELAEGQGVSVEIRPVYESPARYHPNTAVFLIEAGGERLRLRGASVGGGEILVESIDGYRTALDGSLDALLVLHRDEVGVIAEVSRILARAGLNIASAVSHRKDRGDEALLVVELDQAPPRAVLEELGRLPSARRVVRVPAIRG